MQFKLNCLTLSSGPGLPRRTFSDVRKDVGDKICPESGQSRQLHIVQTGLCGPDLAQIMWACRIAVGDTVSGIYGIGGYGIGDIRYRGYLRWLGYVQYISM